MGDLVNLNHARKARAKQQAQAEAAANRVKHGRGKAEKLADRQAEARRQALLDGAKRDPGPLDGNDQSG
ncbi:DUF4169 family protein [Roseomonas sp. F4]